MVARRSAKSIWAWAWRALKDTVDSEAESTAVGRSEGVKVGRWQEQLPLADAGGNDGALPSTEGADTEIGAPGVEET